MSECTRKYLPVLKRLNRLGEKAKRAYIKKGGFLGALLPSLISVLLGNAGR